MKTKNKFYYSSLIISIIVLIINIIAYKFLPNRVPVHWGINGEVNRYGPKMEHLIMSAVPLVLFFVLNFLPAIDPKKESFKKHTKAYSLMILFVIILISGINLIALCTALGFKIKFLIVFSLFLGVFFIGMGNYMSQIRPNYFVGIRTPWTLASEYVWRKTHRFGGWIFILIGIIQLLSIFIGQWGILLFLGAVLVGVIVIYVYSYVVFVKNK